MSSKYRQEIEFSRNHRITYEEECEIIMNEKLKVKPEKLFSVTAPVDSLKSRKFFRITAQEKNP